MLRKRNKLSRSGSIEMANSISLKLNKAIVKANTLVFKDIDPRHGVKDLWNKVNNLVKRKTGNLQINDNLTAEDLNCHYANISNDSSYKVPLSKSTANQNKQYVDEFLVFNILDHLHHTAKGLDQLPAWFLRLTAPIFSDIISFLFNLSLNTSHVPTQWKTALIIPIPKTSTPTSPPDYRPLSIVPILSRILEKIVVRKYIYPEFDEPPFIFTLSDQFAFRPTGSTSAAIIQLLQHISDMLVTNDYVTVITMDYSKAFDTVRHSSLMGKLSKLDIDDNIFNWINNYFGQRVHVTKFKQSLSRELSINASVIQGSGLGPCSFIICASDLHPIHPNNHLLKYADDMYLLVGSSMKQTILTELNHISTWAKHNNLSLNQSKTYEMIVSNKGYNIDTIPFTTGIVRVNYIKVLGVHLQNDLKMNRHISEIIKTCSSSFYALRILRSHGLATDAIYDVARATTITKLLYASPSWWGFTNAAERDRIEGFIRKLKRLNYLPTTFDFASAIVDKSDDNFFKQIVNNNFHVLHKLLPDVNKHQYNLRNRIHNFVLPVKDSKNFVTRMLYKNIY